MTRQVVESVQREPKLSQLVPSYEQFVERLRGRLVEPLPGAAAQRRMEPELSYGRHTHEPPPNARRAAVAVLLYPRGDEWLLPLVVRPETMTEHAGQVGLPGGRVEPFETSQPAALRELEEELGVPRDKVEVIGRLSELFLFVSNFAVTPWLVASRDAPVFVPSEREVCEVLEIPVAWLGDERSRSQFRNQRAGIEFTAPCFLWRGHPIWGATAIMLSELADVVGDALRD
jgi:8-oxo-dGTP pyrophosphatase MutT (NUDIX family)